MGLSDPKTVLDPPELLVLSTDGPDPELAPFVGVTPVGTLPIPVDPVDPVPVVVPVPEAGFRPEAEPIPVDPVDPVPVVLPVPDAELR